MRTKTLVIAAAALAVGMISSQAQVYSQNVVGYANIATTGASINYAVACQFTMGASNGLNEVFGAGLPPYSAVLVWNVGNQGYDVYISDPGSPSGWDDGSYTAITALPTLPVGQGFLLNPSAACTNTFAGPIPTLTGQSNNMVFAAASINYLVASPVPYSGSVTNGNNTTGGPNLGPTSNGNGTPDYSALFLWNIGNQGWDVYIADPSSSSGWDDGSYTALPAPPTINVGDAFLLNPSAAFTWNVGL